MNDRKNQPAFEVIAISGEGDDVRYVRIGAAWPAKTGSGFNLQLDALPLSSAVLLRPRKPKAPSAS